MAKLADASAERIADHFINYVFAEKADNRHVRRVASWVGLIVLGIEKLTGSRYVPRSRQLRFEYDGRCFKAKFNHSAGARGGIEIVEIEDGRGSPGRANSLLHHEFRGGCSLLRCSGAGKRTLHKHAYSFSSILFLCDIRQQQVALSRPRAKPQ